MMKSPNKSTLWLALALLICATLTTACGRRGEKGETTSSEKITIKLAENPWTGSSVNNHVAKLVLETLGHKVEMVTLTTVAQWPALATGDIHASLEVWPSFHHDSIKQYIDGEKLVARLGELGVVGKNGWYVPSYVVKEHPELATFEGFKDPAKAALFKTAETGDKGRFLDGDPSWVQFNGDIIRNHGLHLQVVSSGSEQAQLAALESAYSRKEPILFYIWTPHAIHARYDLTEVELPPYSEACYAKRKEGGVDCGYAPDVMFKVVWSGLEKAAPEAYEVLKNFHYTTEDQLVMIGAVEIEKKSAEEAARAWMASNEARWKAWLPASAKP